VPQSGVQSYRRNLPHIQKDFTPHFVTFYTKSRWILPPEARDITIDSCIHDDRVRYALYVAVVMPDHVHMILTPLIDRRLCETFSLIRIMQSIKGASARAINQKLNRNGPVWQEESFDHVLRSSEGLDAKVEYVLQNPVRKGLVGDWHGYRWCWKRANAACGDETDLARKYVAQDAFVRGLHARCGLHSSFVDGHR